MTKLTPELWVVGEQLSLKSSDMVVISQTTGLRVATIHPPTVRSIAREPSEAERRTAHGIVAAHNNTYGADINPKAVLDLLSFAVARAENDSDECVRNAATKIVIKAKPGWRPKP